MNEQPRRGGSSPDPTVAERVITAVLDELAESGLAELSMDRVARRAGVSKTTVYTRWRHKDDLVLAAYQAIGREFPPIDTGTLQGDLDALWTGYEVQSTNRRYLVALAELIGASATNTALRHELHLYMASWRAGLSTMFTRAQERGELAGDVDVELLAELVQSISLWRPVIGDLPVDARLRDTIRHLVFETPPTC